MSRYPQKPSPPARLASEASPPKSPLKKRLSTVSCRLVLTALCISGSVPPVSLRAQSGAPERPVPPEGPLWKVPKSPVAWSIIFKYTTTATGLAADFRPSLINVILDGENSHQAVQFNRSGVEVWKIAGRCFISEIGSEVVFPHRLSEVPPVSVEESQITGTGASFSKPEPEQVLAQDADWPAFSELSWVTPQMFRGRIPLGNQFALIYADIPQELEEPGKKRAASKWPEGPLGEIPLQPGIRVLAVDEDTRLPMVLQIGEELRQYRFQPSARARIELPGKVKQFFAGPL